MRSTTFFLAASSCVHATWLRWSVNHEPVWAAQETAQVTDSDHTGWTPIPTPAPGARNEGDAVLDLLRRQISKTDWTNSETCGWYAGISSSAFECGTAFTCATDSNHVIACTSGTFKPFYSACLDYSAFQAGSCASLDSATGCCQSATAPACGTYLWTGAPERSMYECFETASIVTMIDVPQFVVDASIFSKTHTTSEPTTTGSGTGTDNPVSTPGSTGGSSSGSGGNGSGSSGGDSGSNGGSAGSNGSSGSNGNQGDSGAGSGTSTTPNNTPIIVGSVVGGVAGLLLLLLILLFLHSKAKGKLGLSYTRNKHIKQKDNSTKAYHTTNLAAGATKDRSSTGSGPMTVVPIPSQQQPQHHYYNQEQHHYHPQAQIQPQQYQQQQPPPQYQAGGQQPVSMSYTVNEGATHVSQPSYSYNSSHTAVPANMSSSGAPPQFVLGGVVPVSHQSADKQQYQQPQPQFQQQYQQPQQQQQQAVQSQLQPVNHIHVYYATPPTQNAEQHVPQGRGSPDAAPDALGLYTQYQEQSYGAHGPGYRQSF
ncbi:hypothetical protein F4678DRAFT_7128 [Xylaria arbuscula]|nr:hypothetical protein F4678DRAFT_7128 [Xylaria arbuscula]